MSRTFDLAKHRTETRFGRSRCVHRRRLGAGPLVAGRRRTRSSRITRSPQPAGPSTTSTARRCSRGTRSRTSTETPRSGRTDRTLPAARGSVVRSRRLSDRNECRLSPERARRPRWVRRGVRALLRRRRHRPPLVDRRLGRPGVRPWLCLPLPPAELDPHDGPGDARSVPVPSEPGVLRVPACASRSRTELVAGHATI